MKLDPFTKIIIQNEQNIKLKYKFLNKKSKNTILVFSKFKFEELIKKITTSVWRINLIFGELIILKSDEVPNKKIKKNSTFWKRLISTFSRVTSTKKYPPSNGGILFVANFWCEFSILLISNFFDKYKYTKAKIKKDK